MADNCMNFLLQAPQPPTEEAVQAALSLLQEVGAIHEPSPISSVKIERLTSLGKHLAKLPVHVRLGKMLVFGALFKCLDKILTIVACLSCSRSPFATSIDDARQNAAHRTFEHPVSDFLTLCNVWEAYSLSAAESSSQARRFCDKYYLNHTAFVEINDLRKQFLQLLRQIGFVGKCGANVSEERDENSICPRRYNVNSSKESVVGSVICAGLYPNLAHAIKTTSGGVPALWHNNERLYFHNSSVNHKKVDLQSEWVAFFEKFETSRVYISSTSLVKPFAILLFGKSVIVKHLDKKVVVDDWIELNIAAKTGVMFRELRHEVDSLLKNMIENISGSSEKGDKILDGIINLLVSE